MKVNGKELEVEVHGDGDAVVMVHGLGGTSNTWFAQRRLLSRWFKVVCPDLHGSGRSPVAGTVSIDGYVQDVLAVMDALGIAAAHLVGHSMGTIVCQHLAASHGSRVRSLVLIGPLAEPLPPARKAMTDRAVLARDKGMVPIADALLGVAVSDRTRAQQPAVCAMLRESLMRQDPEGYARSCEALAAAQAADPSSIRCPTLLLTGDEDQVGPPARTRELAGRIAGATVQVYGATGHWTPLEEPFAVNQALLNFYFGPQA